jgi:sarcosine oxidase gamma subunit
VSFADLSHLTKQEVRGRFEPGRATREGDAWWCPYTSERALVLGRAGRIDGAVDVTCVYAALAVIGPLAGELFARFTALDLRPEVTPVGAFRPGSVARTPGAILRAAEDRYLMLFGAALGEYMWTVVADAAARLGGGPVSADA